MKRKNTFRYFRRLFSTVTIKSSCVNARGILTAAYQVLHLLSCMGGTPYQGVALLGVPHLGYPPSDLARGVPHPCWGVSHLGYPPSDLAKGVPHPCWGVPHLRYPQSDLAGVPPQLDLAGVPPPQQGDLAGWTWLGYPPPSWTWPGYPPGWTWLGYPPPPWTDRWTDGWMDRHVSKHNLPSYYVRGR